MTDERVESELMSTGRAARACGVSTQTIVNWIRQGRLKAAMTVGGRYRVYSDSLALLMKANGFDEEGRAGRARIYVVDDDEAFLSATRRQLAPLGEIEVFSDGYRGLLAIAARLPDVLVLDMRMPSFDGASAIAALRAEETTAQLPIVVATGLEEEAALARRLGATAAVVKGGPVSLRDTVSELLEGPREIAR